MEGLLEGKIEGRSFNHKVKIGFLSMHIHDLILLVIEREGEKGLRGRTMTEE